jgi:Spy/CpxP family protein refolding chaperone
MKRNALLASFILFLAATPAWAQTEWTIHKKSTIDVFPQTKGAEPLWHAASYVQALGLTPDQQKKMDDVLHESRLRLIPLEAALKVQEMIMEPLMAAEQLDEAKILAQIDRVAQARADLEKANARMLLGIRQVLTLEQWTKLQNPYSHASYYTPKADLKKLKPPKE